MNEMTNLTSAEQRRYELSGRILIGIKTHPSKYGNSHESMRDAARHAIKQADALLDMLGREKRPAVEAFEQPKQGNEAVKIVERYKAKLESHRDNTELSRSTEQYKYGIRILELIIHDIKRNQEIGKAKSLTLEQIVKTYAEEATAAWKIASHQGDKPSMYYFNGYQMGLRDALSKASGEERERGEFNFIQEEK